MFGYLTFMFLAIGIFTTLADCKLRYGALHFTNKQNALITLSETYMCTLHLDWFKVVIKQTTQFDAFKINEYGLSRLSS